MGRGVAKQADTLTWLGSFPAAGLAAGGDPEGGGRGENLLEVERTMVSKMWRNLTEDKGMTWDGRGGCASLVIEDDVMRRLTNVTDPENKEDNVAHAGGKANDVTDC